MTDHDGTAKSLNETEVRFSLRSLLIMTAGVAAATAAIAAFVRRFPPAARLRLAAYWGVSATVLVALVVYHARKRHLAELKAGHVHFRLSQHSYFFPHAPAAARALFGVFSLLAGLLAGMVSSIIVADSGAWFILDWTVFGLMFAATGVTAMWWRQVRLAENGIVVRSEFVRWENCRWYWDPCDPDVLVLDTSKTTNRASVPLTVPAAKREALLKFLEAKAQWGTKRGELGPGSYVP
jgi:hypothetical protein